MKTLVYLEPGWEKYSGIFFEATRGLSIVKHKEGIMPESFWAEFFPEHKKDTDWQEKIKHLSSSPCVFIILNGDCTIGCIIDSAKEVIVRLRKKYNKTSANPKKLANASESDESAKMEIELVEKFFSLQMGCKT